MSLDALKALKDKLKQEAVGVAGEKKYVKRAELEAAKLKKLREEEEKERQEKERKRKQQAESDAANQPAKVPRSQQNNEQEHMTPMLSREETIWRLRALGQPATLFGEEDYQRLKRLLQAEKEMHVEDEHLRNQQDNVLLELARQQQKAKPKPKAAEPAAAKPGAEKLEAEKTPEPEDPVAEAFKRAAAQLAEKRAEESMPVEDRIIKYVQRWSQEWEEDLEQRPDEVKNSGTGRQTTLMFGQTMKYLEPLYDRLKHRSLHEELLTGLWMMVSAMRDRNYLHANDIYLRLAIGNAPWPIGVTSVGIHERSAREKISHVMNTQGQAHIMNDEATRKFLQAFKRLITFVQRAYPTDPSRSVDFNTCTDEGRGAAGAGSDKLALLIAEAKGEDWKALGLPEAPHYIDQDGSVKVPRKWHHILAEADRELGRSGSPARGTPPRGTPPRSVTPPPS